REPRGPPTAAAAAASPRPAPRRAGRSARWPAVAKTGLERSEGIGEFLVAKGADPLHRKVVKAAQALSTGRTSTLRHVRGRRRAGRPAGTRLRGCPAPRPRRRQALRGAPCARDPPG